jgi:hypothetical protein
MPGTPASDAYRRRSCPSPCALSHRFTGRSTQPSAKPDAEVQASIATFTQVGIGTVRVQLCLPTRSTMHQRRRAAVRVRS